MYGEGKNLSSETLAKDNIIFIFLWAQMVANFENPLLPPFGKGGLGGF
jgi:hypothetical protein